MKMIAGLGNFGREYENTRHNVGFLVLDQIAQNPRLLASDEKSLSLKEDKKFQAFVGQINVAGEKIVLVKPATFMNNSGAAVAKIAAFYKIAPKDVWVISDDLDLPVGTIRVRLDGSSGGHKGLESIIKQFGSDFVRIRLGIGQATQINRKEFADYQSLHAKDFVLSPFTAREKAIIEKTAAAAAEIIIDALGQPEGLAAHTLEVE